MKPAEWPIDDSVAVVRAVSAMVKFQIVFETAFAIEVEIQAVIVIEASLAETGVVN
jgi:hypothetical protein